MTSESVVISQWATLSWWHRARNSLSSKASNMLVSVGLSKKCPIFTIGLIQELVMEECDGIDVGAPTRPRDNSKGHRVTHWLWRDMCVSHRGAGTLWLRYQHSVEDVYVWSCHHGVKLTCQKWFPLSPTIPTVTFQTLNVWHSCSISFLLTLIAVSPCRGVLMFMV